MTFREHEGKADSRKRWMLLGLIVNLFYDKQGWIALQVYKSTYMYRRLKSK